MIEMLVMLIGAAVILTFVIIDAFRHLKSSEEQDQ